MRFLTILLVTLAACGTNPSEPVGADSVAVRDNSFGPAVLEVASGTTVTWVWQGHAPHDVVGDGFASEIQDSGEFTHTFDTPGTYDYVCTLHPGMTGTVTVRS